MEQRSSHFTRALTGMAITAALAGGCQTSEKPRPLAPAAAATLAPRNDRITPMEPLSAADQGGQLNNPRMTGANPARAAKPAPPAVEGVSQVVQNEIKVPGPDDATLIAPLATTQPATQPATQRVPPTTGVSSGHYYEVGGVVANVNGTAIYAEQIIKLLDPMFSARAREFNQAQFREFAKRAITKQRDDLVRNQLEYAAAERYLDEKEKELADVLTAQWRTRQITDAGGSLAIVRDRYASRGENFDQKVQDQYKIWMSRIYYEKHVMPRIVPTAHDFREYYDAHRSTTFTEQGTARFRLIKVDPAKHGGREGAARFASELYNRITKAGESFESIARSANDDPRWLKSGGDLGTAIQQNAFAIPAVEKAVWDTPVGQVTPVIDAGTAFYIALVEEKKAGKVQPFEDYGVQVRIEEEIRARQFGEARQRVYENLIKDAAIHATDSMMNVAVEMAMQNYPRWAAGK